MGSGLRQHQTGVSWTGHRQQPMDKNQRHTVGKAGRWMLCPDLEALMVPMVPGSGPELLCGFIRWSRTRSPSLQSRRARRVQPAF